MNRERPTGAKKPGLIERAALLAGLALTPKAGEPEPHPPAVSAEEHSSFYSQRLERRIARLQRDIRPSLPGYLSQENTTTSFYNATERQMLLDVGYDLGVRTYKVLFAEDVMRLEGTQGDPSLDASVIAELAEKSIDQEVDQLTRAGYEEEKLEDYRERVRAVAQDALLMALRQDLLPQLSSVLPERAQELLSAFSLWDPTNEILPAETEERQETDGNIIFFDRDRQAILQDLLRPLPEGTARDLMYLRIFRDLDAREEE